MIDMKTTALDVLSVDGSAIRKELEDISGRACGRIICEALADSAMNGEIKAAQLLMELAGEDVKSRELEWKHGASAPQAAPSIIDVRPE